MQLKRTKKHYVLKLSHTEFRALFGAVESIGSESHGSSYRDVGVLLDMLRACLSRAELLQSNSWVVPGIKMFRPKTKTQDT